MRAICWPRGSSPHTRGAPSSKSQYVSALGIIPAYAGSTASTRSTPGTPRDHPRIRGEHFPAHDARFEITGSSPHTRGAPYFFWALICASGIIPAYAGSTHASHILPEQDGDHPRIRGEHAAQLDGSQDFVGSSPHTRGARRTVNLLASEQGIIPAYAGSTDGYFCAYVPDRDHPRIRGEHPYPAQKHRQRWGSSPHTRGALLSVPTLLLPLGIIPAYAGSTITLMCMRTVTRDHPRIRGEHSFAQLIQKVNEGSSPHTRGALSHGVCG